MTEYQAMVREFNIAMNVERGGDECQRLTEGPRIRAPELRARLIEEEVRETVEAIDRGDLVETVDGLCDVLYVAYGAADVFGVECRSIDTAGVFDGTSTWPLAGEIGALRAASGFAVNSIRYRMPVASALYWLDVVVGDCWLMGASLGLDLDPFFREVHRTNMEKLGGPVDEHGKRLKPPGWQPPRIAEMLREMGRLP